MTSIAASSTAAARRPFACQPKTARSPSRTERNRAALTRGFCKGAPEAVQCWSDRASGLAQRLLCRTGDRIFSEAKVQRINFLDTAIANYDRLIIGREPNPAGKDIDHL